GITVGIGATVLFGADSISPLRKKMPDVLKMVVIDEPHELPPKNEEPPPPPPPPPKNLPKPKPTDKATPQPQPVAQPIKQNDNQPEPVGMDADSFGSGTGGPAFAVGTTLMGTPGEAARGFAAPEEEKPKPKLVEARPRAGNPQPSYTERARRLGVQGLMVVETEIDELGKVTRAVVRGKLEPILDAEAVKTILNWRFDPASIDGRAIASTKWLRVRFALE
ncbi:MAG: TonB family protein, partial [Polyangiales bacterium]